MTDNAKLPWRQQYEDAVAEQDLAKLPVKLAAAEDAILIRQMELAKTPDTKEERRALTSAILHLRAIQVEKLNYPDADSK